MAPLTLNKLKLKPSPEAAADRPKKKVDNKDKGWTEKDVVNNRLPDYLNHDMDIVFIGINPGLKAAYYGRYYAGPGNHFYPLLSSSQLVPVPVTYEDDENLLQYKIGLTNIVARVTRSSADLKRSEIKEGALLVREKLKNFKPKIAVFNGKCIYEEFDDDFDKNSFRFGLQPKKCGETALWVTPSSSARCAHFPRMEDKLHFFTSLKKYLAYLKKEIDEIDEKEFIFEGKCKQAVATTSKMWRRQGTSAFVKGGKVVNKHTLLEDSSEEYTIKQIEEKNLKNGHEELVKLDSGLGGSESEENSNIQTRKRTPQDSIEPVRRSTRNIEKSNNVDFVSLIKQKLAKTEENEDVIEQKKLKLSKLKTRKE